MDTKIMICMRCGAWDEVHECCNERECGINSSILTKGKCQGFNCKEERYLFNQIFSRRQTTW